MKKYILTIIAFCATQTVLASDARNYTLFPKDTELTEIRLAVSETEIPSGTNKNKLDNQLWTVKHTHYFELFNNLAALQFTLPIANTRLKTPTLNLNESGMGDPTILFGFGLYNTPALSREELKSYNRNGLSLAGSVSITLPTGDYNPAAPLNIGTNRSSQKMELNTSYRLENIMFEANTYGIHYSDNNEYRINKTLSQKNLYGLETHISMYATPQIWISLDTFNIIGGETSINNINNNNKQRSFSTGLTAGYKLSEHQMVKLIYQNTNKKSEISSSLEGVALSYNYIW